MVNKYKDFQDTMQEVINSKAYSKFKNGDLVNKIVDRKSNSEKSDFHDFLRKNVNLDTSTNIGAKDNKQGKKQKEKQIEIQGGSNKKVVSSVKKPEIVMGEKENALEDENKSDNIDQREESYKYMYTEALKHYYALRERLYKNQLNETDISLDDRNYMRLLEYENFLRKCDSAFRVQYGSFIGEKHKEIGTLENNLAYENSLYAIKLISDHQEAIVKIDDLNAQIEQKADEIIALNEAFEKGDIRDYESKSEILEQDYIILNAKMSMMTPNILELYRQEQKSEEQEEYTTKTLGTVYEKAKKKKVLDRVVINNDRKIDARLEDLSEDIVEEKDELVHTGAELATSYIEAAETALKRHDSLTALELISKAQEIVPAATFEEIIEDNNADLKEALEQDIEFRSKQLEGSHDVKSEIKTLKKQVEDQEQER